MLNFAPYIDILTHAQPFDAPFAGSCADTTGPACAGIFQ